MFNLPENREFPRMTIDCGITYQHLDEPEIRHAVAKNISSGGVLFVAAEEPEVGAMMEIRVGAGNMSIPPLSAVVEVVRVSPGPDNASGSSAERPSFEVGARIVTMK